MMRARVHYYNWRDIKRLIFQDCGLATEEQCRTSGEIIFRGNAISFADSERGTVVEVRVYDKPYSERLEEHAGDGEPGGA